MSDIKPITPTEAGRIKFKNLPPQVIKAWNELIAKNFDGKESIVYFSDAVTQLVKACNNLKTREEIIDSGYLDIESVYRNFGWTVVFDKPGYNETYKAKYIFKVKEGK